MINTFGAMPFARPCIRLVASRINAGSAKANGRNPNCYFSRVFNFKLGFSC